MIYEDILNKKIGSVEGYNEIDRYNINNNLLHIKILYCDRFLYYIIVNKQYYLCRDSSYIGEFIFVKSNLDYRKWVYENKIRPHIYYQYIFLKILDEK